MLDIHVRELDLASEGRWSFADSKLRWHLGGIGMATEFDPFPAYRHDMLVVKSEARRVTEICPPIWDIKLLVANRESVGRTNATSSMSWDGHYNDDDEWIKDPPVGLIIMSGKRTPPHPAVTRHLVAHEYGHHIEYMLEHLAGSKSTSAGTVVKEYAKLRGLDTSTLHHGDGGTWHNAAAEIFACDFRIVVCHAEPDFWPHEGVPRPTRLPFPVVDWWDDAVGRLRAERQRLDSIEKTATLDSLTAPE